MIQQVFSLLCLVFLFGGCSFYQITSEETTFDYYPAKSSAMEVQYLKTISQPYKLIGYVTVTTERNQKLEDIIEKLEREAASLGADAITNITTIDRVEKSQKAISFHLFDNANIRESYVADVVVFHTTPSTPARVQN